MKALLTAIVENQPELQWEKPFDREGFVVLSAEGMPAQVHYAGAEQRLYLLASPVLAPDGLATWCTSRPGSRMARSTGTARGICRTSTCRRTVAAVGEAGAGEQKTDHRTEHGIADALYRHPYPGLRAGSSTGFGAFLWGERGA